jgi:hypothetical protein
MVNLYNAYFDVGYRVVFPYLVMCYGEDTFVRSETSLPQRNMHTYFNMFLKPPHRVETCSYMNTL